MAQVVLERAPQHRPLRVYLTSTSPAAPVPASILIPVGSNGSTDHDGDGTVDGSFTINTDYVTAVTTATLKAIANTTSRTVALRVDPITVRRLTVIPTTVRAGTNMNAHFSLSAPAGPGGVEVTLTSTDRTVLMPAVSTLTIPEGTADGRFLIYTNTVTETKTAKIRATANNVVTGSVLLTVTP